MSPKQYKRFALITLISILVIIPLITALLVYFVGIYLLPVGIGLMIISLVGLFLFLYLKKPVEDKGESDFEEYIDKLANKLGGYLFKDKTLTIEADNVSCVSYIYVSKRGVFSIETIKGSWIAGRNNEQRWRVLYGLAFTKETFYNPIMKNRSNVSSLKAILGEDINIYPLEVLISPSLMGAESDRPIRKDKLEEVITEKEEVLTEKKVKDIYLKLLNYQANDLSKITCPKCRSGKLVLAIDEDNNKYYKCDVCDYVNRNILSVESGNKCPICGDFLVLKKGRPHSFYQCHNPECGHILHQDSVKK